MPNYIKQKNRVKAIQLYRDGYKVADIAKLCNVSQATIWRYLQWIQKTRSPKKEFVVT